MIPFLDLVVMGWEFADAWVELRVEVSCGRAGDMEGGEAEGCEVVGEAVGCEVVGWDWNGDGDWDWDEELGVGIKLGLEKDEVGVETGVGKEEELEV